MVIFSNYSVTYNIIIKFKVIHVSFWYLRLVVRVHPPRLFIRFVSFYVYCRDDRSAVDLFVVQDWFLDYF